VGEPLNPEAVVWSEKVFGQPFHDNWWQTETGGIMIANSPGMEVKPGLDGQAASRYRGGHRRDARTG
jgi:acetyl-CoA synthetase